MSDIISTVHLLGNEPIVDTNYGKVRGVILNDVVTFKGIPFAQPPVGKLRFLPPQPPQSWNGIRDCLAFRDSAVQAAEITPAITHSEDCLYLNIWAPAEAMEGDNLPVLVYIHGGGFSEGSPAKLVFEGSHFAEDGVIQVNITYRLGALGFMAFEEIEAEYGVLGNCGLLDQIAALRWVQENIAYFGGNPGKVTICGESAGAFSVSNLILSPLAKGLFRRAIMQSGNILGQPIISPIARGTRHQALVMSKAYAASLHNTPLSQFRLLDAKTIARGSAFHDDMTDPPEYNFWPVFDGNAIPENPYDALINGHINEVDILAGYNTDEGTLFISKNTSEEDYIQLCWRIFGEKSYDVLNRFPVDDGHSATFRARNLIEMGLRFGSDVFADELSRRGKKVWFYNFNYQMPLLDRIGLGTTHAIELVFVFKTLPKLLLRKPSREAFVEDMHARWLNFIKTGDPNKGKPVHRHWPAYTAEKKQTIILQSEPLSRPAPHAEDVAFYRDLLWKNGAHS